MNLTKVASPAPRTGYVKAGLGKAALKSAFGAAVAMGVLGAGQAQAVVIGDGSFVDVTVAGHDWRVTTFYGTYFSNGTSQDNSSKFAPPPAPGVMPWWGNRALADAFASAVGSRLGVDGTPGREYGPEFAYDINSRIDSMRWRTDTETTEQTSAGVLAGAYWAQATKVPGPLPVLGLAAVFGYSRKLRKRIKDAKPEVISTTAV